MELTELVELVKVYRRQGMRPMVHKPDCRHVKAVKYSYLATPVAEADAQNLVACRTCLGAAFAGQTLESVRRNAK